MAVPKRPRKRPSKKIEKTSPLQRMWARTTTKVIALSAFCTALIGLASFWVKLDLPGVVMTPDLKRSVSSITTKIDDVDVRNSKISLDYIENRIYQLGREELDLRTRLNSTPDREKELKDLLRTQLFSVVQQRVRYQEIRKDFLELQNRIKHSETGAQ